MKFIRKSKTMRKTIRKPSASPQQLKSLSPQQLKSFEMKSFEMADELLPTDTELTQKLFKLFHVIPHPDEVQYRARLAGINLDSDIKKNQAKGKELEDCRLIQVLWAEFLQDFNHRRTARAQEMLGNMAAALRYYSQNAPEWSRTLVQALESAPGTLERGTPFKIGVVYKDQGGHDVVGDIVRDGLRQIDAKMAAKGKKSQQTLERRMELWSDRIELDKKIDPLKTLVLNCKEDYLKTESDFSADWTLPSDNFKLFVRTAPTQKIDNFKLTVKKRWRWTGHGESSNDDWILDDREERGRDCEFGVILAASPVTPPNKQHHDYIFLDPHGGLRCPSKTHHDAFTAFVVALGHEIGHVVTNLYFKKMYEKDGNKFDKLCSTLEEARNVGKALLSDTSHAGSQILEEMKLRPNENEAAEKCFLVCKIDEVCNGDNGRVAEDADKDKDEGAEKLKKARFLYRTVKNLGLGSEESYYRLSENMLRLELGKSGQSGHFPNIQRVSYLTERQFEDPKFFDTKKDKQKRDDLKRMLGLLPLSCANTNLKPIMPISLHSISLRKEKHIGRRRIAFAVARRHRKLWRLKKVTKKVSKLHKLKNAS